MKRNRNSWMYFLILSVLPACSSFSQIVRHSDPLTPQQHMQLGTSYEMQGLTKLADQQYQAAIRLQKKYIPAHIAQGNLAFTNGDNKKAAACYRRVLRLDRNHAGANNNLALVYLSVGKDLDKAERYAQIALKQGGPLRPYVLETLASLYAQQSRRADAWNALEAADAAAPSNNTALCEQLAKTRERIAVTP